MANRKFITLLYCIHISTSLSFLIRGVLCRNTLIGYRFSSLWLANLVPLRYQLKDRVTEYNNLPSAILTLDRFFGCTQFHSYLPLVTLHSFSLKNAASTARSCINDVSTFS